VDAFKAERDWLCHSIFAKNGRDLLNRARFAALLQRLAVFKREASELQNILNTAFDRWCFANGISEAEMQGGISRILEDWRMD
jgi:hypothetical protein